MPVEWNAETYKVLLLTILKVQNVPIDYDAVIAAWRKSNPNPNTSSLLRVITLTP